MIKNCPQCNAEFKSPRKETVYCAAACYYLSKKGQPSPYRGRVMSIETRQKMSLAKTGTTPWNKGTTGLMPTPWNKGVPATPEMAERLRSLAKNRNQSGENHWNWQGGITPENSKIRNSQEYKDWRDQVFGRDSYTCQECSRHRKPGDRVILHADHIKPFATHPELRFDIDNGRTLCRECHLNTDTWGGRLQKALYLQKLSTN